MLPRFIAPRGLSSPISYWPIVVLMPGWVIGVGLWELGHFLFYSGVPVPRMAMSTHSPRIVGYVDVSLRLRSGIRAAKRS